MRSAIIATTLVLTFSPAAYVHREAPGRRPNVISIGSRDRHLHGKARIRNRRAA